MSNPTLETVATLAARVGVPQRTIVREVMRCRLPYVSIAGHWRFRERDIEVWLERTGSLPSLRLLRGGGARVHAQHRRQSRDPGRGTRDGRVT